jgi:hypothetical protein
MWPFRPKHTPESVARELSAGLLDGTILLDPEPEPEPAEIAAYIAAAGPDKIAAINTAIRSSFTRDGGKVPQLMLVDAAATS